MQLSQGSAHGALREGVCGMSFGATWSPPLRPELMRYLVWIAAISIIVLGFGKAAAGDVEAVTPDASGILTKCRDWLVATTCNTYQHIDLPPRIAVGDKVPLRFGSNPKNYALPVARIDLERDHCAIFSEAEGNLHQMDRINVALCHPADEGR